MWWLCQSLSPSIISLRSSHLSGTVITLEPFLEHRVAVNTVSMETSLRHTLISGLEQLYSSDDERNLKSWEGFSWWTQLNASSIFWGRRIHTGRRMWQISNSLCDRLLCIRFAESTLLLCLPTRVCIREQLQMRNNFQLDFTLPMDLLIGCSFSNQAGEKQSGAV